MKKLIILGIVLLTLISSVSAIQIDDIRFNPEESNITYNFSASPNLTSITISNENITINGSLTYWLIGNKTVNITIVDIVYPYRLVEATGLESLVPPSGRQYIAFNYDLYNIFFPIPSVGGAGVFSQFVSEYYDIKVRVLKSRYYLNQEVIAKITLINTGDTSDADIVLIYSIQNPGGEIIIGESKEIIKEVPPSSYTKEQCVPLGGIIVKGRCITILERSVTLPENLELGEWEFHVEYTTKNQDPIEVYDTFQVIRPSLIKRFDMKIGLAFVLFFAIALSILRYRKEEDEDEQ